MAPTSPVVDVHTHMYPPSYIKLLSSRTTVPYIHTPPQGDPRLIILPSDDDPSKPVSQRGRPVDISYSSFDAKLAFMATHGITASIISLANPWLDFLEPATALPTAKQINEDLDSACGAQNSKSTAGTDKHATLRLYAFASLPLSAPMDDILSAIKHVSDLPHTRGVILGTSGLGNGLDDQAMEPVWAALAAEKIPVFLHPHYGLPMSTFGPRAGDYGHVLPLALGFPLETTIAIARVYLAGVFDRHDGLRFLLAHSGGTLPFLAGRIESCVAHEREFVVNGGDRPGPEKAIWDVLRKNIYLDAVVYGEPGMKAALAAAGGDNGEGWDRLMFGTDHPFFPPLKEGEEKWLSVESNLRVIEAVCGGDEERKRKILGGNAIHVFNLEM
jgi:predicted TIM-barrel fold metal-dependent hydrolase